MQKPEFTYDIPHLRSILGSQPHVFHCHHYNLFLQQTILDADYLDTVPLLIGAAAEVAHSQLTELFANHGEGVEARIRFVEQLFSACGFGTVQFREHSDSSAVVESKSSHYLEGCRARNEPAIEDYFAQGWLAGAFAAVHGQQNGTFKCEIRESMARGDNANQFVLTADKANYDVFAKSDAGPMVEVALGTNASNIDRNFVRDAVLGLSFDPNSNGFIDGFGVLLTRHYSNYYNRISFEMLNRLTAKFGDKGYELARPLLVEAGRVCSFFTCGGIMTSTEWDAVVKPQIKTTEDWIHGMLSVIDAFGWGSWEVDNLSPDGARMIVQNGYESCGYRSMYGTAKNHCSFLAEGGIIGLMSLVYLAKLPEQPPELTMSCYNDTIKKAYHFEVDVKQSLACGDQKTVFEVSRIK